MKRQRKFTNYDQLDQSDEINMQPRRTHRFENLLEARVQNGDTLQAIALRFHCSIAEIKRLNKIDRDNEIFAHNVIKVPITPHSLLLEEFPTVHKSGQNSPKSTDVSSSSTHGLVTDQLGEKLLVASVNASAIKKLDGQNGESCIGFNEYNDDEAHQALLNRFEREEQLGSIPGPSTTALLECSGADCDIHWIFLFICILAICVAIPLIYVIYIAEKNSEKQHSQTPF